MRRVLAILAVHCVAGAIAVGFVALFIVCLTGAQP